MRYSVNQQYSEKVERKRILLVDEQPQNREKLGRALAEQDYEVLTAASVPQAERRLSESQIDLIVLDLDLSSGDPTTIAKRIAAIDPYQPVLALGTKLAQQEPVFESNVRVVLEKLDVPSVLQAVSTLLVNHENAQLSRIVANLKVLKTRDAVPVREL